MADEKKRTFRITSQHGGKKGYTVSQCYFNTTEQEVLNRLFEEEMRAFVDHPLSFAKIETLGNKFLY